MTDTTTLAHLTDAHLKLHKRIRARDLLGKRLFSAMNWRRHRRRVHLPAAAAAITADLIAHKPDHVAMTGDAVNFGLPEEFLGAAEWLSQLGNPADVSFVPGNHEAIHKGVDADMMAALGQFSTGDDGIAGYPFLRQRGPVAIIGVSTCITTRLGRAQGELGAAQRARLAKVLRASRGMCRVVLIHHPPAGPCPTRKHLRDRKAFAQVIAAEGAELILHGHNHRVQEYHLAGPDGPVPVLGAPSASNRHGGGDDPAEWRLFTITRQETGFEITMQRRRITAAGNVEEAGSQTFLAPVAAVETS